MSQFLFDFVHSLSMREKAYFKRYVNIHASDQNKNYLKIYDTIEGMKSFQKDDLKNHFDGTPIAKYLSSEISYLKNKILTSLINFHASNSPRNKIQKGILLIEILIVKGFRKEAMKKLNFFKKIAYRQEEFSFILRLIEQEEEILFKEGIFGFQDVLKKLKEERNSITAAIQNLNNLRILREEIRELQFTKRFITDDFRSQEDFYKNPILESENLCLSIKAKSHWYYVHSLKCFLARDYEAAMNLSEKNILLLEENQNLFPFSKQLPLISNFTYYAAKIKNKLAFKKGMDRLISLPPISQTDLTYIDYIKYSRHFELAYYTNDTVLTEQTLNLSIELIDTKIDQMGSVQVGYLLFLMIRATIVLEKYELGAAYLNRLFQLGVLNYLLIQTRLFSLIIHYQLRWDQLLVSEILLLKKLVKEFPRDKDVINSFYDFFKKEIKNPNQTHIHSKKLQKRLEKISKDKEGNFVFDDFDFFQWSLCLSRPQVPARTSSK